MKQRYTSSDRKKGTLKTEYRLYTLPESTYNNSIIIGKVVERMEEMNNEEMKQMVIDYYVNLQRIKKAETGINEELEYQLKVTRNKLSALGIPAEDYEM